MNTGNRVTKVMYALSHDPKVNRFEIDDGHIIIRWHCMEQCVSIRNVDFSLRFYADDVTSNDYGNTLDCWNDRGEHIGACLFLDNPTVTVYMNGEVDPLTAKLNELNYPD